MTKKRKWWLIFIPVILLAVLLTMVFWDSILIYAAPKTVLTAALTKTIGSLEERFQEDPMGIFLKNLDPEGKYTANVELETSYALAGDTAYAMTVQTDLSANRIQADGLVRNSGKDLNLSLYLDSNFLAVSSSELVQGNYYGVTYDTFGADIRSIPMVGMLVPDAILQEWEESLGDIQEMMNQERTMPTMPDISKDDLNKLILGILALPCEVEEGVIGLRGEAESRPCHKLTYGARGTAVSEILGYILDTKGVAEGSVTASFYLCDKTLVKADLHGQAGENCLSCSVSFGMDAASGPLVLVAVQEENGIYQEAEITVETQRSEDVFAEKWSILRPQKEMSIAYRWDPATGDMDLVIGEAEDAVRLNLTETEDGARIETEEFHKLMNILDPQEKERENMSGVMTISKGSEVRTPAYKNLDQWSLDDFLVLLGGIGGLLGLKAE